MGNGRHDDDDMACERIVEKQTVLVIVDLGFVRVVFQLAVSIFSSRIKNGIRSTGGAVPKTAEEQDEKRAGSRSGNRGIVNIS